MIEEKQLRELIGETPGLIVFASPAGNSGHANILSMTAMDAGLMYGAAIRALTESALAMRKNIERLHPNDVRIFDAALKVALDGVGQEGFLKVTDCPK